MVRAAGVEGTTSATAGAVVAVVVKSQSRLGSTKKLVVYFDTTLLRKGLKSVGLRQLAVLQGPDVENGRSRFEA